MPDTETEERLTRLENRIKTNFLDIEKKFADLSAKGGADVPGDLEERMREIEDLVLLIQLENTKLKERLGTQDFIITEKGGPDERISKLEPVIENIKSGGAPADLEQRLAGLEQKLSAQLKEGVDSRISKLESDIKDLRTESGKMSPMEVEENIAKINSARIELDSSISKFRLLKGEIEKSMSERQELISRLNQAEVNVEKAGAYFTKMKTAEEKITATVEKIESLNEGIDAKMRSGSEKIELTKRDIENRLAATEDKFKYRLEKLDASMESMDIKSRGIDEKIDELQAIEKDLSDVASIKTGIEEQSLRTASMERNISTINKRISDIHKIKAEVEEELSIRASLEKRLEDTMKKLDSLQQMGTSVEKALSETNSHLEEESTLRQGMESRLQDTISEIENIRSLKEEIGKTVGEGVQALDNKIASVNIEEQFAAFDKKVEELQQTIEILRDPVSSAREMIEKATQEKTDELNADVEELKQTLHLDEIRNIRNEIAEHRKVIQSLKADLEIAAARFFTANLEEFALVLDKKFPGFVSREEYGQHLSQISQRIKTIEAPDLSPLATRVGMVEKKLDDVHEMMQSLARTMPIVIE